MSNTNMQSTAESCKAACKTSPHPTHRKDHFSQEPGKEEICVLGLQKFENFADAVASASYSAYARLPKAGKPVVGSEWTLLSTIVKMDESVSDDNGIPKLEVVSLGTGSKCIGRAKMSERGDILNDSHAEVLARRGFLFYLYHHVRLVLSRGKSDVFFLNNGLCELLPGISFHFFSSHPPCGDASIFPKNEDEQDIGTCITHRSLQPPPERNVSTEACKHFDEKTATVKRPLEDDCSNDSSFVIKKQKLVDDIHRTGAKCLEHEVLQDPRLPGKAYHVMGAVRTKPGRGDPTLSVSCSDKLTRWNCVGIQGALLSRLLANPLYMQSVIIGGEAPFSLTALDRGIVSRVTSGNTCLPRGYYCSRPNLLQATQPFPDRRSAQRCRPSPCSIVWCSIPNRNHEVAVNGQKQGVTKKLLKTPAGQVSVCKKSLMREFIACCLLKGKLVSSATENTEGASSLDLCMLNISKMEEAKYKDLKDKAVDYQTAWSSIRNQSCLTWTRKPPQFEQFCLKD